MARVCIVDLLFNWPPDAGARVDTLYLARNLLHDHEVTLVVPSMKDVFPRGRIDGEIGVPVQTIAIADDIFTHQDFCERIRQGIKVLTPDVVILGDAWHLKARLLRAMAEFRPIVRFYTHESLCIKGHGHQYKDGVCPVDTLAFPQQFGDNCLPCFTQWQGQTRTKVFDREIQLAQPTVADYQLALRDGLGSAFAAVVSNWQMVDRLRPHVSRVVRQPMGIDPKVFFELPVASSENGGKRRFLLSGRAYDFLKGGHVLIDAASLLWRERQDFEIAMTGQPTRTLDATQLSNLPFVKFLEAVPHERVPELLKTCFACVAPALWPEPFPLVGVESLACGRPVIATAVGGQTELFSHESNALLIPANNAKALKEAMRRLLDEPVLVERLRTQGLRDARQYHWEALHQAAYGPIIEEFSLKEKL